MDNEIKYSLRDNAIDSLDEALERYQNGIDGNTKAYKYAVLSLSHFIELSFKYFISKINPILIYKKPFAEKLDSLVVFKLHNSLHQRNFL